MLQHIVLILPPAVELVFSFTLAVTSASMEGKKRWILVLDGLSFFLLALTDFLAHVIPELSSSVHLFSIVDTFLAAASLLPLLFYTVFLFLFARSNFFSSLPTRFSRIITFSLIAAIPTMFVANELNSLVGLAHTALPTSPNHPPVVGVGFSSVFRQHVSLFFAAACLALLTLFQAILFMVSFVRLARGFVEERRIENARQDPNAREEIHLFRGLGWLVVGLKLGAIETIVGFANNSFGAVFARRALRLFSRGTLIIGVLKGLNIVEDISSLESDLRARSGSTRRIKGRSRRLSRVLISNPRLSTFQELSPAASSFHAVQFASRERRGNIGPSPLSLGADSNLARFNGAGLRDSGFKDLEFKEAEFKGADFDSPGFRSKDFKDASEFDSPGFNTRAISMYNISRSSVSKAKPNQRVTVQYDGKTPPVLQVRFSTLDMEVHPPPVPLVLPNPYDEDEVYNPRSLRHDNTINGNDNGADSSSKNAPLEVVHEDSREDQPSSSLSEPRWDRQLFYVPPIAPLPRTGPSPPRPLRDPRRASYADARTVSYAAPSFSTDVGMPFRDNGDREDSPSPRSSQESPISSSVLHHQFVSRPFQGDPGPSGEIRPTSSPSNPTIAMESPFRDTNTTDSLRRSTRTDRTVSGASDSLDAVHEIAARFPGLPPRVVRGSQVHPPGLREDADADSDAEWRMLARARSLKRRREMEAQQQQQAETGIAAVGGVMDLSTVNSIKRKSAPPSDDTDTQDDDAAVSEAIIARAAVVRIPDGGRGHTPSSYYSSSSEDDTNARESTYTVRNTETPDLTLGQGTHNTETPELTPGPWTPSPTAASVTQGLRTPASLGGGDERQIEWPTGRATAVGLGDGVNTYLNARPEAKLLSSLPPQRRQPRQSQQQRPVGEGNFDDRRLRRLTLLRRELSADANDPASASATTSLEPEMQAHWLHTDPLAQLQTIGTGAAPRADGDEGDDEDAVLDDAWRRAGLTRIKSVSTVRVHTTPRVEQGFEVRGSLVAVEDDLGASMSPVQDQERQVTRRASEVTLKKLARSDSGVLGEEDRKLIRQGRI